MATVAPPRAAAEAPAFEPYVSPAQHPAELIIRALVLGAALFAKQAEAAGVPAADYLGHLAGLERGVGPIAASDLVAILAFLGLGGVLYRVARR
jgi:hypothetical protein